MTTSAFISRLGGLSKPFDQKESDPSVDNQNRRNEIRHDAVKRLFLQVVETENVHLQRSTCTGHTVNAAPDSIQLTCKFAIPEGSLVEIWCDRNEKKGSFFLAGQAIWSLSDKTGTDEFEIGIRLLDRPGTDLKAWRKQFNLYELAGEGTPV